jgi:hypothetical protein
MCTALLADRAVAHSAKAGVLGLLRIGLTPLRPFAPLRFVASHTPALAGEAQRPPTFHTHLLPHATLSDSDG